MTIALCLLAATAGIYFSCQHIINTGLREKAVAVAADWRRHAAAISDLTAAADSESGVMETGPSWSLRTSISAGSGSLRALTALPLSDPAFTLRAMVLYRPDGKLLAAAGRSGKRSSEPVAGDDALTATIRAAARSGAIEIVDGRYAPVEPDAGRHLSTLLVPLGASGKAAAVAVLSIDHGDTAAALARRIHIAGAIGALLAVLAATLSAAALGRLSPRLGEADEKIRYLAHHDSLTGLANRNVFYQRLRTALRDAHFKGDIITLLYIDVDKFKEINDKHGHAAGDLYLEVIAERLREAVGRGRFLARLSGDEFAVIVSNNTPRGDIERLAGAIIEVSRAPVKLFGDFADLSFSIGIARSDEANWRASQMQIQADLALYEAKKTGRSKWVWYAAKMEKEALYRRQLVDGLKDAVEKGQFRLSYHPQVDLTSNEIDAYEALIRWDHPQMGAIGPADFIPIAEQTGYIARIGEWVLRTACAAAATWPGGEKLAVNVSPAQFLAGDIAALIVNVLSETGLAPERLEVEITEDLLMIDTEQVLDKLRRLSDAGVDIVMDDFGTGYSSLSYLTKFHFDKIKIDRSFIHDLGRAGNTDIIVSTIISLGRSLNVRIAAEGIETPEQEDLMRRIGCDLAQGFLYGVPEAAAADRAADEAAFAAA